MLTGGELLNSETQKTLSRGKKHWKKEVLPTRLLCEYTLERLSYYLPFKPQIDYR